MHRSTDFVFPGPPNWLPRSVMNYLDHVEGGEAIRALARKQSCHPSTILRQVRRFERRRDEFLIDQALKDLGQVFFRPQDPERTAMTPNSKTNSVLPDKETVEREGRRVLRRLSESGAVLAVAKDMEKAVVVRDLPDGRTIRTGVVDQPIAQAMALKDWITCKTEGRVSKYRITQSGKAALRKLLESDPVSHHGFAEAPANP